MHLKAKHMGGVAIVTLASGPLMIIGAGPTSGVVVGSAARLAGAGGVMIPAPNPTSSPAPATANGPVTSYSYNWSGYAQTDANDTFTGVVDTWTVAKVNTSLSGQQFSADWVGIGGFNDGTLVQAGTEADNINGTAHYDAWTEVIPAPEVVLKGLTVHPGDQVKTIVEEIGANVWAMEVENLTTGKSGEKTVSYDSSGESAETIHERPCIKDDCATVSDLAKLSQTNNVTFTPGEVDILPAPPNLTPTNLSAGGAGWSPILSPLFGAQINRLFMVNNAGNANIASPSKPSTDLEGFSVADGPTAPPAP